MTPSLASQYLKLGIHLEYLRGITSITTEARANLRDVPALFENQTGRRYSAIKVVAVLKSLLALLEELDLKKSLVAVAEFRVMLAEIETYLGKHPNAPIVTLQDPFANTLVDVAERVLVAVREDIATAA